MPEWIEILCLANSRKHSGRCVAGLRTDGGGWIRPVGNNALKVLMPKHFTLPDFSEAMPLDLLRIPVESPAPLPHHPEDWLVGGGQWELLARPAPPEVATGLLRAHLVRGPALLGTSMDRIPFTAFQHRPATASLALLWPKELLWKIIRSGEYQKRKTRIRFRAGAGDESVWYDLALTDPEWESRLQPLPVGEHPQETAHGIAPDDRLLLTVSLSEPLGDKPVENDTGLCFKLVAAVIVLPRTWWKKSGS